MFFCFICCFLFFPFFASEWQKACFPPKKGHYFLLLSVFLCFSWAFFGLPLVQFLFFCLSLSLSFLLFFFFLPSCFSFGSFFFSLSFLFCLLCFCFMTNNIIKIFNCKVFFHQSCVFFGLLSCFLFEIPFFLSLFLMIFGYVVVSTSMLWVSKKHKLENTNFWSKGVATKRFFFYNLCFAKCEKLSVFAPFWAKFWLMFKSTLKLGISAHFWKQNKKEKLTILKGYCLGQVRVIIWAKFVAT